MNIDSGSVKMFTVIFLRVLEQRLKNILTTQVKILDILNVFNDMIL